MTSKRKARILKGWPRGIGQDAQLIFCSFAPVGLDDYVTYFSHTFDSFVYLKWRFPHSSGRSSTLAKYSRGEKVAEKTLFCLPSFQNKVLYFMVLPFNYVVYAMQCMELLWKRDTKPVVIFVGVNYFCAFCGVLLRKLGRVDMVVYRVMDFFPLPTKGIYRYLNRLFYVIDRYCLDSCDHIWFTTEGHIKGREKYGYFDRTQRDYHIVPLGLSLAEFRSKPVRDSERVSLVYCGVVSKYHLLDLLFEVTRDLKRDYPGIRLNMIGSGPDEGYFRELAGKMDLEDNVVFHGFLAEGDEFRELMTQSMLGIALYRDVEDFMKYTEPAKVKLYLKFGVPAVVSRVPVIADELEARRVCFAVANRKDEIVDAIRRFVSNRELQIEYKENIGEFVKTIDINRLLDNVFAETFGQVPRRNAENTDTEFARLGA